MCEADIVYYTNFLNKGDDPGRIGSFRTLQFELNIIDYRLSLRVKPRVNLR